jgi:hypothetical protein
MFVVATACTSIAGLDGDYTIGDPSFGGSASTQAGPTSGPASGGGTPGAGGASSAGGSSSSAGGAGGGGSGGLGDGALFARYSIDKGASGPATGTLTDSAPNPQPLTLIAGGGAMDWIEPAPGQRGILWDMASAGGQASTPVNGTKFTQLWGRTNLTVEAVATLIGNPGWHARLFHLGDDGTAATLQLSWIAGEVYLYINDLAYHRWVLPENQRLVLHLVLDTTIGDADRARLFVGGNLLAPSFSATVPMNEALAEEPDALPDYFVIGNTDGGSRAWNGAIHYLALYTATFTPQRVATHAAILGALDDGP